LACCKFAKSGSTLAEGLISSPPFAGRAGVGITFAEELLEPVFTAEPRPETGFESSMDLTSVWLGVIIEKTIRLFVVLGNFKLRELSH
jgi:hypothetical protein